MFCENSLTCGVEHISMFVTTGHVRIFGCAVLIVTLQTFVQLLYRLANIGKSY